MLNIINTTDFYLLAEISPVGTLGTLHSGPFMGISVLEILVVYVKS